MGDVFTPLDITIFLVSLVGIMAIGLWVGRKEESTQDYFLAGRSVRWWGVAGSIFGSNVSANHLVGMMGIGFSVGFAQAHFELGAIAGLMLLCYGFLPVYRKLGLYTLSDYLRRRYDDRSCLLYALIMILIMVVVQMVFGFYIGSRSINVLFSPKADVAAAEADAAPPDGGQPGAGGQIARPTISRGYYTLGVIALAVVAGVYTILGGLKAVIWTDVIQSVLLLLAGIGVAILVFVQPEVGGWSGMVSLDRPPAGTDKMSLYLPASHGELPWTGVFTGLMALHFFYWGTNQFIVQRALGAYSDNDARIGIVAAGFLKLLIPFFAIGGGIAAYYLFQQRMPGTKIDPDAAFTEVVKIVVAPGWGIAGLIATGLIGAILSSIDSMMNSAATIVTFDVYQRYINPDASEKRLIWVGRIAIVVFVTLAALLAILVLDPNSQENFFLQIVDQQSHLTPGLLVAFFLGMFWSRATATAAFVTVLAGPLFSYAMHYAYAEGLNRVALLKETFGEELNMFHRVAATVVFCIVLQILLSLVTRRDAAKGKLTWTELGGHDPGDLRRMLLRLAASLAFFAALAWLMVAQGLAPASAGLVGAAWTFGFGVRYALESLMRRRARGELPGDHAVAAELVREDRFWAGILCAVAVFMLFYFY